MLSQFENVPSQSVRQKEFAKNGKVKFESQTFKFKVKFDPGLAQYSLPFPYSQVFGCGLPVCHRSCSLNGKFVCELSIDVDDFQTNDKKFPKIENSLRNSLAVLIANAMDQTRRVLVLI